MSVWEILLFVVIVGAALVPLVINVRQGRSRPAVAVTVVLLLSVGSGLAWSPPQEEPWEQLIPPRVTDGGYTSSKSCRSCHPNEYASWHRTYHRTMTQLASPETVVAPFDNVHLESRGRQYHLERAGDQFWVTMVDPDWEVDMLNRGFDIEQIPNPPIVNRRVLMTTGSHHMQGYWIVSSLGDHLRQIPWYYHIADQKWIPREDTFLESVEVGRHFKVWNDNCIKCHSVNGNPGRDFIKGKTNSRVAELGISCEACHGPGEVHARYHRNPLSRYRQHIDGSGDATIVNPAKLAAKASSEVCGQCHSSFEMVNEQQVLTDGFGYRPGGDLEKQQIVLKYNFHPKNEQDRYQNRLNFWDDGTCRVGGDEYNGLVESPCFQRGKLACVSCHSMHRSDPNDQLAARMDGNQACLQCHQSFRNRIEEHTHHPAASSGSLCYNCHMPHTSYALLTAMRSHRIDSPNTKRDVKSDRPNACNLCHLDRTLKWSVEHLAEWFGQPPVEVSQEQEKVAASVLWLLRGDAVQRAIAAWHMGWEPAHKASGNDWQAPFLAQLMNDPYSTVRSVAFHALRRLPEFEDFQYDFVGSDADREQAKQRALNMWRKSDRGAGFPKQQPHSILLTPDGQLNNLAIQDLLKQRIEVPISIPE